MNHVLFIAHNQYLPIIIVLEHLFIYIEIMMQFFTKNQHTNQMTLSPTVRKFCKPFIYKTEKLSLINLKIIREPVAFFN